MKINLTIMFMMLSITGALFGQGAINVAGSNTSIATFGNENNQYDYLLSPLLIGKLKGKTIFFALDNSAQQFGGSEGIQAIRGGWALKDGFGLMFDYKIETDKDQTTVDDNNELSYIGYNLATGRYTSITETINTDVKNNTIDHDLLLHGAYSLSSTMGVDLQFLYATHVNDTSYIVYTNTYTDTAAVSDASLTGKGNRTEITNTLLQAKDNDISMDIEFGLNKSNIETSIALGLSINNLRADNSYTSTVTSYSAGTGIDNTIRDQNIITSYTGQYYGAGTASFTMNGDDPDYLSTIGIGIGSVTELHKDNFDIIVPFNFGVELASGDLNTVFTSSTVKYNDADVNNIETEISSNITTTTFVPDLDLYISLGGGIKKVFTPAENATVTITPMLGASFDIKSDTRNQIVSTTSQIDGNSDGDYLDEGIDNNTTYTESGYEIKRDNLTSEISFYVPLSTTWKANKLLTFNAGYYMRLALKINNESTLTTGSVGLYETYTDNLTAANSYTIRQKDGTNSVSTPTNNQSTDFSYYGEGRFGVTLNISENFTIDMLATGNQVKFDAFSVMGTMSY